MQWTPALSVGIDIIDEQHKELFAKINDLVVAIKSHTCKYKIGDVVKFLEDYVVFHFGEEQRLMLRFDYPGYKHHKAQHEEFMRNIDRVKEILPTLEGGRKPGSYDLSVETNQLVVDWIIEHISRVDKAGFSGIIFP
ncbi:MAG: bacteriohemerythrin [Nitrospirota bacterium]